MPGLSLFFDSRGELPPAPAAADAGVQHLPDYRLVTVVDEPSGDPAVGRLHPGGAIRISYTAHDAYPLEVIEDGDVLVILEGHIYSLPAAARRAELISLARRALDGAAPPAIAAWQDSHDGEYVLLTRRRSDGAWALLTDPLGQLPIYCCCRGTSIGLSREIAPLMSLLHRRGVDRLGLSQLLVLGYCLGGRTPFADVRRIPSGSMVRWTPRQEAVEHHPLHRLNLEAMPHGGASPRQNAHCMADLLTEACRIRGLAGYANVLALSGGLDSRLVAGAFVSAGVSISTATFVDVHACSAADAAGAQQVAACLRLPFLREQLEAPAGRDLWTLLRYKFGLNYLGMGFILPFYRRIRQEYGANTQYLTGDTGILLKDHPLGRGCGDLPSVARYLVGEHDWVKLDAAAELAGVAPRDILESICQHLDGYPERTMEGKYQHFRVQERALNWLTEGIDRNRLMFWSSAPLHSLGFFRHAAGCPASHKAKYQLYRGMLSRLNPQLERVPYAQFGAILGTANLGIHLWLRGLLRRMPRVKELLRPKAIKPGKLESSVLGRCFRQQCRRLTDAGVLSWAGEDLWNRMGPNRVGLLMLFTAASAMDIFMGPDSSIEEYRDAVFEEL